MSPPASQTAVRPVERHQISRVINFVRGGFEVISRQAPDALRPLFEYSWTGGVDKPNLGFALWSGNDIVGFLGAVYAERPLAGRLIKTCNLSTWYVRPDFQRAGMKLLYAVMSQKDYSITNFTASPAVQRIMEALRFEPIDRCKWVYLPWHFSRKMLQPGPDILTSPEEIARVVVGEDEHFLRDHVSYRVKHYVLRDSGDYSYLILKRRTFSGEVAFNRIPIRKVRLMWYPCMEVLYLGNLQLAVRHWGSLVATILRREHVLAVVSPERLLGPNPPAGARLDHQNYLLARTTLSAAIDGLYSELAVLPF